MIKRYSIIVLAGMALFMFLTVPASAQQQSWAFGGGYWSLPNVDSHEGAIDTSGFYASGVMRSVNYILEFDYSIGDTKFYALAADYIYPLGASDNYFGTNSFIGAGYTYFSADELENESGLNVMLGANFGDALTGSARYDWLGSDQELLTFGVTYSF